MKTFIQFLKEHLLPVIIFLATTYAYFFPVLEGKKIVQGDIIQSLSMQGEMNRYSDKGENILWTNNMFSGMPTFQIRPQSQNSLISNSLFLFNTIFGDPSYFMIMSMLGIYFFCLILGINRWLAVIAAIGFAFSSFNIISIEAGHSSKVRSMALIAPLLASIIYSFREKMIAGVLLTTFFVTLLVRSNHMQITYYTVIIIGIYGVFELYRHYTEKRTVHFIKTSGLLIAGLFLALLCNTTLLWTTYDYGKSTIRGGLSELSGKEEQKASGGLDKEYAFAWSQGIAESFTFIVPAFSGGSSGEILDENSETFKTLISKGVNESTAKKIITSVPTYWGNQPFTAGPIYFGCVVIFLMLFGLIVSKNQIKWWMLACMLLAMFLAWGKNFSALSYFFFDYIPMYNKFRTPAMMLSVIMLFAPITAVLGLNEIIKEDSDKNQLLKSLKISGGVMLGLCVLLWAGSGMFDFSPDPKLNDTDKEYFENYKAAVDSEAFAQEMLNALIKDREQMMKSDALRSLIFIAVAVALLYLFLIAKVNAQIFVSGLIVIVLADLWQIDKRYLDSEKFVDETEYMRNFRPRQADIQILKDPDIYYRVHDITRDPFNSASASYFHKTIGGYHAAKLQRYQDIIEKHLRKGNMNVVNMLNTKYFIVENEDGPAEAQKNPGALGNAWMVNELLAVNNADEEIAALTDINPDSIAVFDGSKIGNSDEYKNKFTKEGNVKLTSYHPDKLVYQFESPSAQFIVFSDIYYNGGKDWKSYVDGREFPHLRCNYILRGMEIPAGKHEIVFEFRPESFYTGEKVSLVSNILFIILTCGYLLNIYRKKRNTNE
jgi:hypothetical protein